MRITPWCPSERATASSRPASSASVIPSSSSSGSRSLTAIVTAAGGADALDLPRRLDGALPHHERRDVDDLHAGQQRLVAAQLVDGQDVELETEPPRQRAVARRKLLRQGR